MNIFLRTFNNKINSKSGERLPEGQYRGTPEWIEFQEMLGQCLGELGHRVYLQPEHPYQPDVSFSCDKRIYVHQCKRDKPQGDLFWMQMHLRNLFTLDTDGWGFDHSACRTRFNNGEFRNMGVDESSTFVEELSNSLLRSGESKCEQPLTTDEMPNGAILVPIQIPRDYTIKYHSPITVKYFIESLQAWATEVGQEICFKMHPNNRCDIDLHAIVDEAARVSPYVHKVEGNIHELIKRSIGVFVINSGTGFEALVHGKPVATFGECDYNVVSYNADIRRLDEARDFVYSYQESHNELAAKFVHYYCTKHAYDVRNPGDCKVRLMEYLRRVL